MEIMYDPVKDARNVAKHGLSLRLASLILEGNPVVVPDRRLDYGEDRFIAYGFIAGRMHACVFTLRGGTCRVISLRKANRREIHGLPKAHQRDG